jgi:RNA polymerase sigma factor (sigma-70 family)
MCAIAMNDATLIHAAQQGCPDAWEQLFLRYQPRIHGLARAIGTDDADGVCGATWCHLVRYLDRYECRDDGVPFWAWLAVVVKRIMIRMAQRSRLQVVYDVPMVERENLEQTALGRVFAMQLLARLPEPIDRQVLEWRVWHDLTFVEIGQRLGIHKTLARDYYNRALADLRAILNDIAPPEKHIHHAPSLSKERQAECIRRYTSGELTVKQLAALYGVSPITMNSYVRNTKTITCARCGAADVRPGAPNRRTCGPCLAELDAAGERWCAEGQHAVVDGRSRGPCSACAKIIYQRRKATGYYDRAL